MAKRSLCLLLALVTLFSLSVPAFAEEEEVVTTEEPVVTEEPVTEPEEAVEVTEEPVVEPEEAEEPVATEEPVVTEEPVEVTEEPVVTEASAEEPEEVTEEPEAEPETAAGSSTSGGNVQWSYADGTLTISGTGNMTNYTWDEKTPWNYWLKWITTVVIQTGVTSIGNRAFDGCPSLTSVTIPDSVTSIGTAAFENCDALANVAIPDGVTSIGASAFYNCDALTNVAIPGSVTSIGNSAFYRCDALTSVTIPDGVTSIGNSAFYWCKSLTDVTISGSVTSIGNYAFNNCDALTNVTIQEGVTGIGSSAFSSCGALASVTIPGSVTSIGEGAFTSCTSLTSVTIQDGVTSIGKWAFENCTSLTSVTIPASVTEIGEDAFTDCESLTIKCHFASTAFNYAIDNSIQFELLGVATGACGANVFWELNGTTLTISGTGPMADYDLYDYSVNTPWKNLQKQIQAVVIQPGVTSIGNYSFYDSYLTSVTIPDSVTSIGNYSFYDCTSLISVTIPNSVTTIGEYAFHYCEALTNVTIPDSVTSIGDNAFYECKSLTGVTIPSSVTSIGESAFSYCDSLTSITIPNGVTSIGSGAFGSCASLNSVTIKGGVKTIGEFAFSDCDKLSSVAFSCDKVSIGKQAFEYCTSLTNVAFQNGESTIGEQAFRACGLTDIELPLNVTSIGGAAFYGCTKLANVTIRNKSCTIVPNAWVYLSGDVSKGDAQYGVGATFPAGVAISGYKYSSAETYAEVYGHTFRALDGTPTQKPTVTPVPTLSVPTVTISQTSDGIKVTWNKITGSPRYMVYYKENGGSWTKIGTTTATTYTRKAADLKNGATYQFAVRCCANDKKTLLSSFKASNSLQYATAQLAAPTVKISKISGGIKVTWNKIDGSPRYMVYYRENGGAWKKIGTTTVTSYIRAAKYLKDGKTYAFTVRCCADDKTTLLSTYKASSSLLYSSKLAAPTVTIAQASNGIKVSWTKVASSPRYMVYYRENNGGWKKIGTTTALTYTRAAKYLKNNVKYTFTVRCCANDKTTLLSNYKASNSLTYKK